MELSSRWVYTLVSSLVLWAGFHAWQQHQDEQVRRRLPLIEQALNDDLASRERKSMTCLFTPSFSQGIGAPRHYLVRQPNGLSRCMSALPEDVRKACKDCDALQEIGLLDKHEESVADGQTATVYRLSAAGRDVYYENISTHERVRDDSCTPGEEKYVAPEKEEQRLIQPGFCLAEGVHVRPISEYLPPIRLNNQTLMSVRVVMEADKPSRFLFDPRMRKFLSDIPAQQNPALYKTFTTTAVFSADGKKIEEFTDMRYGKWAVSDD